MGVGAVGTTGPAAAFSSPRIPRTPSPLPPLLPHPLPSCHLQDVLGSGSLAHQQVTQPQLEPWLQQAPQGSLRVPRGQGWLGL